MSRLDFLAAACEHFAEQEGLPADTHYYQEVIAAKASSPKPEPQVKTVYAVPIPTTAPLSLPALGDNPVKTHDSAFAPLASTVPSYDNGALPVSPSSNGSTGQQLSGPAHHSGNLPTAATAEHHVHPKYRRHKSKVFIRPNKVVYLPTTFMEEAFDPESLPIDCEMVVEADGMMVEGETHNVTIKAVPRHGLSTMYCMTNVMRFQQQYLNWQILNWTKVDDRHLKIHLQGPCSGTNGMPRATSAPTPRANNIKMGQIPARGNTDEQHNMLHASNLERSFSTSVVEEVPVSTVKRGRGDYETHQAEPVRRSCRSVRLTTQMAEHLEQERELAGGRQVCHERQGESCHLQQSMQLLPGHGSMHVAAHTTVNSVHPASHPLYQAHVQDMRLAVQMQQNNTAAMQSIYPPVAHAFMNNNLHYNPSPAGLYFMGNSTTSNRSSMNNALHDTTPHVQLTAEGHANQTAHIVTRTGSGPACIVTPSSCNPGRGNSMSWGPMDCNNTTPAASVNASMTVPGSHMPLPANSTAPQGFGLKVSMLGPSIGSGLLGLHACMRGAEHALPQANDQSGSGSGIAAALHSTGAAYSSDSEEVNKQEGDGVSSGSHARPGLMEPDSVRHSPCPSGSHHQHTLSNEDAGQGRMLKRQKTGVEQSHGSGADNYVQGSPGPMGVDGGSATSASTQCTLNVSGTAAPKDACTSAQLPCNNVLAYSNHMLQSYAGAMVPGYPSHTLTMQQPYAMVGGQEYLQTLLAFAQAQSQSTQSPFSVAAMQAHLHALVHPSGVPQ